MIKALKTRIAIDARPLVVAAAATLLAALLLIGIVQGLNSLGLAPEIIKLRWYIWAAIGCMSVGAGTSYTSLLLCRRLRDLQLEAGRLRLALGTSEKELARAHFALEDSNDRLDSAFRILEQQRAESYGLAINTLKRLAVLSIMQPLWAHAKPHVVRLKIDEESQGDIADPMFKLDRLTVMINLGQPDRVTEGMQFAVLDAIDKMEYGVIQVVAVHPNGSSCKIVHLTRQSFWAQALEAIERNHPFNFGATDNEIVIASPLRLMPPDAAEQLLIWLEQIQGYMTGETQ